MFPIRKARENVLAKCDYRLVASQYEAFFKTCLKK